MRGGPRGFQPGFPCPAVLRCQRDSPLDFAYGAVTHCGRPFQAVRLSRRFITVRSRCDTTMLVLQPRMSYAHRQSRSTRFGLVPFRSPLLRESRFLSVPPVTEMFHFTGLPSPALCVQAGIRVHYDAWVPPFGNPRIKGWSAPPRGLSQPPTSFIGSSCQGIHRTPFIS